MTAIIVITSICSAININQLAKIKMSDFTTLVQINYLKVNNNH